MLTIQSKELPPDITILEMTGRITMGNDCLQIEWTAKTLLAKDQRKLIFDLTNVSHIDSTGIGIIVNVAGQMKQAGGALRVAGCNAHVERMLHMTSVDTLVGLHPTAMAAASSF